MHGVSEKKYVILLGKMYIYRQKMNEKTIYSETCFKTTPQAPKEWSYITGGILSEVQSHASGPKTQVIPTIYN